MSAKIIIALSVIFFLAAVSVAWYFDDQNNRVNDNITIESQPPFEPQPVPVLTEQVAKTIAERDCIKGGEALGPGTYNEMTKTWWFNANLNATRPGCNPACVVSEDTGLAEINWRCTGAIPPGPGAKITNFNECVAAGYPILKSNPPQCVVDGRIFTEQTGQVATCSDESRKANVCARIFDPVCATVEIQCIKAPCDPVRQDFSNPCEACLNPLVKTYTTGGCMTLNVEVN
jgi:hypothetical protein